MVRPAKIAPLPSSVDLRPLCPPIEDQGELGSCTANALVGALEFLELKEQIPYINLSRLFIYYNERVLNRTVNSDSGASLREGIKTLSKQGVCDELLWAYIITKFESKPSPDCYAQARHHKISSYYRLTLLNDMKQCLASGYPFVFGFTVYDSFESPQVAHTGIVNMPQPSENVLGGHAVVAVGYDDTTQRFIVRNSWGSGWGMQGYFTIPYGYLANSNLSDDFWTIRR
jgi:C1A family cysteine protease